MFQTSIWDDNQIERKEKRESRIQKIFGGINPNTEWAKRQTRQTGFNCIKPEQYSRPMGHVLRTLLHSDRWHSKVCFLRWQTVVTPEMKHFYYQLIPEMPLYIKEDDVLWMTPTASSFGKRSAEAIEKRVEYRKSIGRVTAPPGNLAEQVRAGGPVRDVRHKFKFPEDNPDNEINPVWVETIMGFPADWTNV